MRAAAGAARGGTTIKHRGRQNSRGSAQHGPAVLPRLSALSVALVAVAVLAFQPGGLFRFVWVKVLVLILAAAVGALSPGRVRIPRPLAILLAAAAVWILISMASADNPWVSLWGRWPRHEGVLIMGLYVSLFLVGTKILRGSAAFGPWTVLRLSLAVVGIVLACISGLESFGLRVLGGEADVRPGATLGNATDMGIIGFLIAGLLSTPLPAEVGRAQWLRRAGFVAGAAVAVLSGSRAALAGLAIILTVRGLLWIRTRQGSARRTAGVAALAGAALAGAVLLVPSTRERLFFGQTVEGRFLLWGRSLDLISDHALVGVGPSGFIDSLPPYLDQDWIRRVGEAFPVDSPHSWPLQVLAAGGVPLLVLAIAVGGTAVWFAVTGLRAMKDPGARQFMLMALTAVLAYAAALLTHFSSVGTTALVAFVCGGLIGECHGITRSSTATRATPVSRLLTAGGLVLAGAALVVALPATAAEWPMSAGARAARTGDPEQANLYFKTAYSLRPWDSDTALLAAQAFAGPATAGDSKAAQYAVEWGGVAQESTPRSKEAGLPLAIGYIYGGNPEQGLTILDALLKDSPYSPSLYTQRGVAHFGLGQVAESIGDLNRAADLDPTSTTPWLILARIHEQLGEPAAAGAAKAHADAIGSR